MSYVFLNCKLYCLGAHISEKIGVFSLLNTLLICIVNLFTFIATSSFTVFAVRMKKINSVFVCPPSCIHFTINSTALERGSFEISPIRVSSKSKTHTILLRSNLSNEPMSVFLATVMGEVIFKVGPGADAEAEAEAEAIYNGLRK